MTDLINYIQNNALERLASLAPRNVVGAIKEAAQETGVDFAYLLQQAKAESAFNPTAKAKTSSASGLFQFIESTWMNMVDKFGDKYGIDKTASKSEILNLRNDPEIASKMAAEFAGDNKSFLQNNWGGDIGATELYFAHFMGAGGAASFLKARDENPAQQAAVLFPKAAKANKNVFYDRETGRAKTLDEVYAFFDKKFSVEGGETKAYTQLAQATETKAAPVPQQKPEPLQAEPEMKIAHFTPPPAVKMIERNSGSLVPASYQSMFANPLDLIMLTQLDLPTVETYSKHGSWAGKSTY
jgi:soluble lytic murein transglycosylase-like protein